MVTPARKLPVIVKVKGQIQNIFLSLGLHSYFVTISFISVIIFKGKNELSEVR